MPPLDAAASVAAPVGAVDRASVCTLDCPDTCSLTVTVEGGRITKVRGSEALPYTAHVICNKVAHHTGDFVHGPGRLLHPLRRVGARGSGEFRRIAWEEALDAAYAGIAAAIAAHGPQSVLPLNYAGPHGMLAGDSMSLRFFHRLGASQLFRRSMCGGVRAEAWTGTYGPVPGIAPEAAAAAKLNLVWGNNATVTNLHLVRQISLARRQGGRLAVVDPLRSKIAEQADLHLQLRPGTDVVLGFALALALRDLGAHDAAFIARHVHGYDAFMAAAAPWTPARAAAECGVAEADILTLARWMAEAEPLVMAPGNGLERGRNGGSGIRAAIALPALLGRMDGRSGIVLGAGYTFPKTPARLTRPDLAPPGTRTLNILDAGRHLTEDDIAPPIRAVVIYNHNPVVVHPDQNRLLRGLLREEVFTLGIEVQMTESMKFCDVVLPAATAFEIDDLYAAYGQHWLQRAAPAIPPLGESLPNTEIFRRLAARFGFDEDCFRDDDAALMDQAVDGADPRLRGLRPSALPTDRALRMETPEGRALALFDTVLPATPSGKVELVSEVLAGRWGEAARLPTYRGRPGGAEHPLALISPASDKRISSTLFGAGGRSGEAPPLLMHPADAAARGLATGARVRVWNSLGSVELALVVSDAVPPGVVSSEKGAWLATAPEGGTISALVSATDRADLSEGCCYNDVAVQVAAA
ncbi:MAG: molybdopterin-dependent oxidoreductase [Acetobacteraceae bacterium]|nr:molybdopterin-dependent oxidoreductase [Acetobacteraceae bacterium]